MAIRDWVGAYKEGREKFKASIDENFKKVEDFFNTASVESLFNIPDFRSKMSRSFTTRKNPQVSKIEICQVSEGENFGLTG